MSRRQWQTRLTDAMIDHFRATGAWRDGTIVDRFRPLVAASPDAALFIEAGITITRVQLWDRALAVAAALRRLGVEAGDVVSFQLPNWHEAAVIDLASTMCGATVNPIVPIYREKELVGILNDCRASLLFIPEIFRGFDFPAMIAACRSELPHLRNVVTIRGERHDETRWDALLEPEVDVGFEPAPVDANGIKIVMYTSGTTGAAKSVLHSHSTIDAEVRAVCGHYRLAGNDTVFMPSPVTHVTGYLYGIQIPLSFGMPAVFLDVWDKHRAVELIEQYDCAFTVGATPFLKELTDAVAARGRPLAALRYFVCGGAPVPPEAIYAARAAMGLCIPGRVYGSTEAPTISLSPAEPDQMETAAESDGRIAGYSIKLIDADGCVVGPGEEGEVAVHGPELFLGYGDIEHDARSFDAEGFFLTGDLARVDGEGVITITGRKKDLIIRGGENISAKEIEDLLHGHKLIAEAAVVAMPHPRLGETCCAVIRLIPGVDLAPEAVMAHVAASGLAKQKIPERIEFVEALPKTASGKILKNELRAWIASLVERQ